MRLLVAVVNYGRADLTIDCLRTAVPEARAVTAEGRGPARIALCDNGSTDDSVPVLREAIEREGWSDAVELTAIAPNRGFTGGNNAVIGPVLNGPNKPDYVLLLNNDTLVLKDAFRELLRFMDAHPQVGIGGARMENEDGTPQRAAFRFNTILSEIESGLSFGPISRLLARRIVAPPPPARTCRCDWVPGCGMIIRRAVLNDIGLLDEGFYTYFDDIDYCWNAHKSGWQTWYVREARIVHLVGQTTSVTRRGQARTRRARYWYEARRRFYTKNYGPAKAIAVDLAAIASVPIGLLLDKFRNRPPNRPHAYWRDLVRESSLARGLRPTRVRNPLLVATSESCD